MDKINIIRGSIPILISVPHSTSHTRNGVEKLGEINTDMIGYYLFNETDCHVFVNTGLDGDPNYDTEHPYKTKLLKYIKDNGIQFMVDIHGANGDSDFDIEVGTGKGKNIYGNYDIISDIINIGKEYGYIITIDEHFPCCGEHRISSTVAREVGIPSIQLEINYRKRNNKKKLRETVSLLTIYINSIKEKTTR